MEIPAMPFKILAMAPFQMAENMPWQQPPIAVDRLDLDGAMASTGVSLHIPIAEDICPAGGLDFEFQQMKDFHPDTLAANSSFLNHLLEAKAFLAGSNAKKMSGSEIQAALNQWPDLPHINIPKDPPSPQKKESSSAIDNILEMVSLPGGASAPSKTHATALEHIDAVISRVMQQIFENERFRAAEAAWQGLKLLLRQGVSGESNVQIEIVPVTGDTLAETISRMTPYLIEHLPGFIIIDLPFDNSSVCMDLMEKIADLAETLMVPIAVQVSSKFLQLASWRDMQRLAFIPHHLEETPYARWQKLKKSPAATWVAATCNRILVRYPYGPDNPSRKMHFTENHQPWTGSVWALAVLMAKSCGRFGWPTGFTRWQDIAVENLALHSDGRSGEIPLEFLPDDNRYEQMIRAGIMPLTAMKKSDAVFSPREVSVANGSLAYQLLLSRVTQFIFQCQASFSGDLPAQSLEATLKHAFHRFWEMTGHVLPEANLTVSAGPAGSDGKIPLHVDLLTPADILPGGHHVVLDFFW